MDKKNQILETVASLMAALALTCFGALCEFFSYGPISMGLSILAGAAMYLAFRPINTLLRLAAAAYALGYWGSLLYSFLMF